ncbi:MAG: hypothetical protein LBU76_07830 [Azoarcus sp.]|jgi:hypothetical protein|nr:hypothetical protein [Azoarcus sp.]
MKITDLYKVALAAAVSACFSLPAMAEGISPANVGVSGMVGTTGVGVHVSVPILRTLNARFGVSYFEHSTTGSTSNVDYKYKLKLNTFDALADWHPMGNGFRVTGGLLWNGNKVDATAKARNGEYEVNGHLYNASQAGDLKGRIDFRDVAPYLGIGWGSAPSSKGWSFSGDLGVIFQGTARASLKNRNCTLSAALCAQLADDIEAERKELRDEVKDYRYYPVIRAGASYRF